MKRRQFWHMDLVLTQKAAKWFNHHHQTKYKKPRSVVCYWNAAKIDYEWAKNHVKFIIYMERTYLTPRNVKYVQAEYK